MAQMYVLLLDFYIWLKIIVLEIIFFSYFLLGPAESCKRGMAVNVNWCSRNFRLWSNPRWQDITFFVFVFSLLFQELVEFTYTN